MTMLRRAQSAVLSVALAAALPGAPASAHDHVGEVAGIVAAGIIGAAIGRHQAEKHEERYKPHPGVTPTENAVGICVHHGVRIVDEAGGSDFRMVEVEKVNSEGGTTVVVFKARAVYPAGVKTSTVTCRISGGGVTSFEFV